MYLFTSTIGLRKGDVQGLMKHKVGLETRAGDSEPPHSKQGEWDNILQFRATRMAETMPNAEKRE
jgi:hypothetical protein